MGENNARVAPNEHDLGLAIEGQRAQSYFRLHGALADTGVAGLASSIKLLPVDRELSLDRMLKKA